MHVAHSDANRENTNNKVSTASKKTNTQLFYTQDTNKIFETELTKQPLFYSN